MSKNHKVTGSPSRKILRHKKKIIFIVGPTATGKSEIAFCLAKKLDAEIVSCDSMQVYQGMGIISSQPPKSLRRAVPHHLTASVSPEKEFNASRYRASALNKIKDIIRRGKVPLFVGGTGLYMSILIDGIFKVRNNSKTNKIRERLYHKAETEGSAYLHNRLKKVDPCAAAKIHPNDTKRIIRALEVFMATGKPISELQKQREGLGNDYDVRIFCLNMDRAKLYKRIEARVEEMFRQGLVDEVRALLKKKLSRTASFAIGLREIKGYLDGEYDLDIAVNLIKKNTRNYAKRQLTWFRKEKRLKWIKVRHIDKPRNTAKEIWKELSL